jgi:predicted nucleotidyltransferase
MRREEAIRRLRERQSELQRLGVQSLYLFGSTARDQAGEDSNVDLFFDYPQGRFGLFELMDVKELAANILGQSTDIVTRDSLHRSLRPSIEKSAMRVF